MQCSVFRELREGKKIWGRKIFFGFYGGRIWLVRYNMVFMELVGGGDKKENFPIWGYGCLEG
jgi:hypothetical protein